MRAHWKKKERCSNWILVLLVRALHYFLCGLSRRVSEFLVLNINNIMARSIAYYLKCYLGWVYKNQNCPTVTWHCLIESLCTIHNNICNRDLVSSACALYCMVHCLTTLWKMTKWNCQILHFQEVRWGKLDIKISHYDLFGMYCCIVYIIFKLRILLTMTTLKRSIMWFSSTLLVGILDFIAFLHGIATVVTQTPWHITIIHYVEFKIVYTVALSFLNYMCYKFT